MSISLNNISHSYGQQKALIDVDLQLQAGEIVALLGPSGCGKTTLLRLIAGLEPLQQGDISIAGLAMAVASEGLQTPPEKRGIGMMFQDYALFPHMTVGKNLEYGLAKHHDVDERRAWLQQAMDKMGLKDMWDRYPHTLSGGQQQRVALLRALAPKPCIMLLDEPFSALDEHLRQQVREDTLDLLKSIGASAVMVTHDPLEALFMADKVVVMDHGHIVQQGAPHEIYASPASAFVAALFGPSNQFELQVVEQGLVTPFGNIKPHQLADGTNCKVIVRAKDVRLHQLEAPGLVAAEVISVHPMGNETHFRLRLPGAQQVFQARVRDHWQAQAGATVWVEVPNDAVFVFAA
ncbi:ABC transporter ATP-binding protein [Aliagarivorans taiwanensis]|uniref:ABC transporter ATP-binding protein n=1 Tax=Aliagarivorans taiwanensis TaxID=561966 RepID=UPI00040458FE|nr:ABC transporter ATP-binding protein [Aliagarivorans taiwanensis]